MSKTRQAPSELLDRVAKLFSAGRADLMAQIVSAEADAKRLAEALGEQMIEADGEPHAYACPKAHKLERECDTRCHDAREALRLHKEGYAGD